MTTKVCDCCGKHGNVKTFSGVPYKEEVKQNIESNGHVIDLLVYKTYIEDTAIDLCDRCAEKVSEFIMNLKRTCGGV